MARSKSPGSKSRKAANPSPTPEVPVEQTSSAEAASGDTMKLESAKPEVRRAPTSKSERATLVPINLEDEIRRRAYELYEQRGYSAGHETEDWLIAEQEVMQRYGQHSAQSA